MKESYTAAVKVLHNAYRKPRETITLFKTTKRSDHPFQTKPRETITLFKPNQGKRSPFSKQTKGNDVPLHNKPKETIILFKPNQGKRSPFSNQTKGNDVPLQNKLGAGRSSEVERLLMVRWVVGSVLHGVDPLSYFSFQPVLHDWCNKGRGMCYPVCGMMHIKEPLLLIDKSSLCGGSGFPFSLSEWSLTICLTPYNRR